jgi:hypothetical protein
MPGCLFCSPIPIPKGQAVHSLRRSFLILLIVMRTLFASKAAPHAFRSFIQASVVMIACKVPDPFAFLTHGRTWRALAIFLRLNRLAPRTPFLRHAHNLLAGTKIEGKVFRPCSSVSEKVSQDTGLPFLCFNSMSLSRTFLYIPNPFTPAKYLSSVYP